MEHSLLKIRSLSVKANKPGQGFLEAVVENISPENVDDSVLLLYFYDSEGRVRDRISLRLKSLPPTAKSTVSANFRLKNRFFFTYSASIHRTEQAG